MERKDVSKLQLGSAGLNLIKSFEGFVPHPYDDLVVGAGGRYPEWKGGPLRGTLTIGYGHTNLSGVAPKITQGMRLTEPEAAELLVKVLAKVYEPQVKRLVKVPLSQNEYDALVSFVYNCGAGNLEKSTLLKRLNAGDYAAVPSELMRWTRSKGQVLRGLERRRRAEAELWRGLNVVKVEDTLTPKDVTVPTPSKPITQTKGFWGSLLSILGLGSTAATEAAPQLLPYVDYHPYVKYAFLSMILVGASLSLWSRLEARFKFGT